MNITSDLAVHKCTSCQMCGAVCPTNAITISLDDEGFYCPTVEENKCIDCGKCVTVCYKYDKELRLTTKEQLSQIKHYAAAAKDDSILNETTSGGVANILAKYFICKGYKVIGVVYDTVSDCAVHKIAATIEETIPFSGSKYIQSYSIDAFRELIKQCKNQKFAIFGLPCQIYAVNQYLKHVNQREQCVLIDLYCHGCPSMFVWQKMVKFLHHQLDSDFFNEVDFRSKKYGWGKFVLEVKGENGKEYNTTPLNNEFYDLFFSNQLLNESCAECMLRSTLLYTDIRLGDFWGKEFKNNKRGVSGVTLMSKIGESVFDEIKTELKYEIRQCDSFFDSQSWGRKYQVNHELRSKLLVMLKEPNTTIQDIAYPIRNEMSLSIKIKRIIKEVLFFIHDIKCLFKK